MVLSLTQPISQLGRSCKLGSRPHASPPDFILAAVEDAAVRVVIGVARYDFSEPRYGKDI